jgi:hypothetical protein
VTGHGKGHRTRDTGHGTRHKTREGDIGRGTRDTGLDMRHGKADLGLSKIYIVNFILCVNLNEARKKLFSEMIIS